MPSSYFAIAGQSPSSWDENVVEFACGCGHTEESDRVEIIPDGEGDWLPSYEFSACRKCARAIKAMGDGLIISVIGSKSQYEIMSGGHA